MNGNRNTEKMREDKPRRRRKNNKPKTKQNFKKGYETEDRDLVKEATTNDPSWYAVSQRVAADAASFPFSKPFGYNLPMLSQAAVMSTQNYFQESNAIEGTYGGVLGLGLIPTMCSRNESRSEVDFFNKTSDINIAGTQVFAFLRSVNSGAANNYDTPTLIRYLFAMGNIYSAINWAMRLYGLVSTYDQENRFLPRSFFAIEHVDYDSVKNNLAQFRYELNRIINLAATFAVPKGMAFFTRLAMVFANIYSESGRIKDQMYFNYPIAFWTFNDKELYMSPVLMKCDPHQTDVHPDMTYQDVIAILNKLIEDVIKSQDVAIISGDILKAYGLSGILNLVEMPLDYKIAPVFDEMILEQFRNASLPVGNRSNVRWGGLGVFDNTYTYIKEDPNTNNISCQICVGDDGVTSGVWEIKRTQVSVNKAFKSVAIPLSLRDSFILNLKNPQPDPGLVLEATALKSYMEANIPSTAQPDDDNVIDIIVQGRSEVVIEAAVVPSGEYRSQAVQWTPQFVFAAAAPKLLDYGLSAYSKSFDYFPELLLISEAGGTSTKVGTVSSIREDWNIDNYAVLSKLDLQRLNEAAYLSLLNVPVIAKSSK